METLIEVLSSGDVVSGTSKATGAPFVITNFKGRFIGDDEDPTAELAFVVGGDRKEFLEGCLKEKRQVRVLERTHNQQFGNWRVKLDIPKKPRYGNQSQPPLPSQKVSRQEYEKILDEAFVSTLRTIMKPTVKFVDEYTKTEEVWKEVIVACFPTALECAEKLTAQYMISIQNGLIDLSKNGVPDNGTE